MTPTPEEVAAPGKYGKRNVPKMIRQVEVVRQLIAAEGTPSIQEAWGAVEEHIDFAYRADATQAAALKARAEAAEARVRELELAAYLVVNTPFDTQDGHDAMVTLMAALTPDTPAR